MNRPLRRCAPLLGLALAAGIPGRAPAETAAPPLVLRIDAGRVLGRVSPTLYGLMTEEINHSYDGGLYAELVRNRTFQDNPQAPDHWELVQEGGGTGSIALDPGRPLNRNLPVSLRLEVAQHGANQRVGVANEGFWGIAVRPYATYHASFYARAAAGFSGSLVLTLESNDGTVTHARAEVSDIGPDWQKFTATLTTRDLTASADNRLVIAPSQPGTVWLDLVSLFPPTFNDRANGNRPDLMRLLAGLKPAFLRFPGGNYVEGRTVDSRFAWKRTIGDLADRPGHAGTWSYRSSDGLGLLEFLEWCEDLRMQPVLAVFAGLTLDRQAPAIAPGPALQPFVQDALDEIEYVTGGPGTRWGAERARNGHPAPFPLTYVEIGNEDNFDRQPGSYDGRFAQFHDAIKARYPRLQLIATAKVTSRAPDVQDDHYYRQAMQFYADADHYDHYSRTGPRIFVGEWATRERDVVPTPNLRAALGDAAWMTGMERNSDLIVMASYAPLLVNVSPGPAGGPTPWPAMQWRVNLIGYDALASYGSPSYYAQQMFSVHHGDEILATDASGIGTQDWQPPLPRGGTTLPPRRQVPTLFFDATRQSDSGLITLKVVNPVGTPQAARIRIAGAAAVAPRGRTLVLTAPDPDATNSIADPVRVVPVAGEAADLGTDFTRVFPPYSITVLELAAR